MSTLISGIPIFSLFAELDHGIFPSTTVVGQIHSMAEYDTLVPAANTRVEMERASEAQEVRVIKNNNGDYHVTVNSSVAQSIMAQVDQQTTDTFEVHLRAYPETMAELKLDDYYRHIIQYDHDGDRILPGIRRAGYLSTLEEYKAMDRSSAVWFEHESFVGMEDSKTGDVWWATEDVKQEVLKRSRAQEAREAEGESSCEYVLRT
jgi:hypothetical protein